MAENTASSMDIGWYADYIKGTAEENLVEVRGLVGQEEQRKAKSSVTRKLADVKKDHQLLNVLTLTYIKDTLKGKYDDQVFPPPSRAGFPALALEAIQGMEHILKHNQCRARAETHLLTFITDFTKFRQDINNKFVGGGYMAEDWREFSSSLSDDWTNKLDDGIYTLSNFIKPMTARRSPERLEKDFKEIEEQYAVLVDTITKELQHALYRSELLKTQRDFTTVKRELDHELKRTTLYFNLRQLVKELRHKIFRLFKDSKSMLFATGLKDAQNLYKLEKDDYKRFINDVKPAVPSDKDAQNESLNKIEKRLATMEGLLSPITNKVAPQPQHSSSPKAAPALPGTPHPSAPRLSAVTEEPEPAEDDVTATNENMHFLSGTEGAASNSVLKRQLQDLREQQMHPTGPHEQQALQAAMNAEDQEKLQEKQQQVKIPVPPSPAQLAKSDPKKETPKNIYINDALLNSLVNKGHKSGCRDCRHEYDYWPRDKPPDCLGEIHRFNVCDLHMKTITKYHGKELDDDAKERQVIYMFDFNHCECTCCKKIAKNAEEKSKRNGTKLPKFATLSKLQSVVKDALKSIKKVVSPDAPAAAKAAANALDRIAAANKEQEKQPEKEKQPIAEESNRDLRTPARRAPPPPGRGATSTRGGSLLDEFATVHSHDSEMEQNADGSYLPAGAGGDPPPPPDNDDRYWGGDGGGGDPNSPGNGSDDDDRRDRRRGRRHRRDSPDPSPDGSPGSDTSDDDDRRRRSSARRRRRAAAEAATAVAQPQRTVLVQQTTLAAAGCNVFTGNPFQYIPWRSIVDSVFKNSQDENAIRHSQLLRFLGGDALKEVDNIQINAHDSVLKVLDTLHRHFYKPEHLKDLKIANLLARKVPGKTLSDSSQIIDCQKYIQSMEEVLECDTLYGVTIDWEFIITNLMTKQEVRDNHYKKWILRCQETAEKKHAGFYKDLPEYRRHQNLNFPRDRFVDFMGLLKDILKVDRYRSNYSFEGGYNHPGYIKKAAKESLLLDQQRFERMDSQQSKSQQGGFQNRNNGKKHAHNYATQQKPSSGKSAVNTSNTPNTPKPPTGFGNTKSDVQKRCIFCNKTDHWGQFCKNVKPNDPGVNQRLYAAVKNRKCLNCLGPEYHVSSKCVKPSQCGIDGCVRKHHKLLHGADFNRIKTMTEGLQRSAENAKKTQEAAEAAKAGNQQSSQPRRVKFNNTSGQRGRSGSRGRNNQARRRSSSRGSGGPRRNQQGEGSTRAATEDKPTEVVTPSAPPTTSSNE